jgi:DNA polymerase sigma
MSVPDRLDYIRRLLRSYAAYVCRVQRIAQARCPVVRFCHKQQKVFCELSINNQYVCSYTLDINRNFTFIFSLAVANTDLTRYFLALEPKLRSLLYTIRLWIKQKDLLGKGHRFNTYTLFWMIVCMLQLDNQQLPSVQSLADRASKSTSSLDLI